MNYGHLEINEEEEKKRNDDYLKLDRSFISEEMKAGARLYFYIADTFEPGFEGKDIVEVACGRGGGASLIANNYPVASYRALDISKDFIDLCNKTYTDIDNLSFVEGDAHALPFEDNSADVIICMHSCFLFTDMVKCN